MKKIFTLLTVLTLSIAAHAQCVSEQISGKRWVCVGREVNGSPARFESPYFYLTLENGSRFTKTSYDGNKVVQDLVGTYTIDNCSLRLSSNPRDVRGGVVRRVEEYNIVYNNGRYMTLSISSENMPARPFYLVYAGEPGMNQLGSKRR